METLNILIYPFAAIYAIKLLKAQLEPSKISTTKT